MLKLPNYNLDPLPRIDLVVAVSFGLLVPPRILKATTYGGINVHPSLLPRSAEIKPPTGVFRLTVLQLPRSRTSSLDHTERRDKYWCNTSDSTSYRV